MKKILLGLVLISTSAFSEQKAYNVLDKGTKKERTNFVSDSQNWFLVSGFPGREEVQSIKDKEVVHISNVPCYVANEYAYTKDALLKNVKYKAVMCAFGDGQRVRLVSMCSNRKSSTQENFQKDNFSIYIKCN